MSDKNDFSIVGNRSGSTIGFITLLILMATAAQTDCMEMSSISAAGSTGIHMVAQDIKAVIDAENTDVSAMYHIIGNGKDKTADVSFTFKGAPELAELSIFTDNEAIPWNSETDGSAGVTTISFTIRCPGEGEYLGIGVTFKAPMEGGKYGIEDTKVSWDLSTAKSWQGTVEDSRFIAYLRNASYEQVTSASPEPTSLDNNRIMWQFGDSEPSVTASLALMRDEVYYTAATALEMLESAPENAHAHFLFGAALFARSLSDDPPAADRAIESLEKALALDGKHTGALWFLAVACYRNGRADDAVRHLETLQSLEPSYNCRHKLFPEALMDELPGKTPKAWLDAVK